MLLINRLNAQSFFQTLELIMEESYQNRPERFSPANYHIKMHFLYFSFFICKKYFASCMKSTKWTASRREKLSTPRNTPPGWSHVSQCPSIWWWIFPSSMHNGPEKTVNSHRALHKTPTGDGVQKVMSVRSSRLRLILRGLVSARGNGGTGRRKKTLWTKRVKIVKHHKKKSQSIKWHMWLTRGAPGRNTVLESSRCCDTQGPPKQPARRNVWNLQQSRLVVSRRLVQVFWPAWDTLWRLFESQGLGLL